MVDKHFTSGFLCVDLKLSRASCFKSEMTSGFYVKEQCSVSHCILKTVIFYDHVGQLHVMPLRNTLSLYHPAAPLT